MNYKVCNAWICQITGENIKPVFGDLTVENGRIGQITERRFPGFLTVNNDDNVIDAGGRVLTVPLVNFHDHIYSRLAKGLPLEGDFGNFQNILKNLWWKLDLALEPEMVKASAEMAAMESIRNGVTYIFDHHASPSATTNSLETIAGVLEDFNLRGVLCFETSDRNGKEKTAVAFEENYNFFKNRTNENIKSMLGLHASFTLDDDSFAIAEKYLRENDWAIHIHLCEDVSDRTISREIGNDFPVQRLKKFNLLNAKSILAHGIYLNESDYQIIKESGSAIVYNIDSNLNNSVGLPGYAKVPQSIPILTGTDGMHANVARAQKQLFLIYRHQNNSFDKTFEYFKKVYFDQFNFVKKYFPDFGNLATGDRADFIIWDYVPPTPFNEENFWGHYIYGILERTVKTVVQKGNILMNNFQLIEVDEHQIHLNIFNQGRKLFNKFKNS